MKCSTKRTWTNVSTLTHTLSVCIYMVRTWFGLILPHEVTHIQIDFLLVEILVCCCLCHITSICTYVCIWNRVYEYMLEMDWICSFCISTLQVVKRSISHSVIILFSFLAFQINDHMREWCPNNNTILTPWLTFENV